MVLYGSLPDAELVRERRAEDEPARLGPQDDVGLERPRERGELVDGLPERLRVRTQRHDVLEDDARLREARDVADERTQIGHRGARIPAGPVSA
jgi:hypothetical protein